MCGQSGERGKAERCKLLLTQLDEKGEDSAPLAWSAPGQPARSPGSTPGKMPLLAVSGLTCFCPYPPQTWFCLGEGLPCLLSSTKLVLLSGDSSSLTTSKMHDVKQLFGSTHGVSRPVLGGPAVQICSFPLGLVCQKLCLARIIFSLATQCCTNLSHLSSHSHGLVTTGKMSDSMWSLILYFLTPPFQNLHLNKCGGLSFDLCPLTFFLSLSLMVAALRLLKSIVFVGEVANLCIQPCLPFT